MDNSPDAGGVVERSFCSDCGKPVNHWNPKHTSVVVVASRTLDYEKELKDWKPEREFYCKRKGPWLEAVEADEGEKFDGMS